MSRSPLRVLWSSGHKCNPLFFFLFFRFPFRHSAAGWSKARQQQPWSLKEGARLSHVTSRRLGAGKVVSSKQSPLLYWPRYNRRASQLFDARALCSRSLGSVTRALRRSGGPGVLPKGRRSSRAPTYPHPPRALRRPCLLKRDRLAMTPAAAPRFLLRCLHRSILPPPGESLTHACRWVSNVVTLLDKRALGHGGMMQFACSARHRRRPCDEPPDLGRGGSRFPLRTCRLGAAATSWP